jgi:hypothetical protein
MAITQTQTPTNRPTMPPPRRRYRISTITHPPFVRRAAIVCWLSVVCGRPAAWIVSRRRTQIEASVLADRWTEW